LAKWDSVGGFLMRGLMKRRRPEITETRLQMWLEEVDEFGMMMMVVVIGVTNKRDRIGRERNSSGREEQPMKRFSKPPYTKVNTYTSTSHSALPTTPIFNKSS
jgi:hypothetical protein